ncbi:MAG: DinB family protein [Actinomycetota bacterium]|nr:DinB family protein [Actinomycetota bacterium]
MTEFPPPADEEDLVAAAPERETLEGFLEYHRRVLSGKLRGLSEEDARRHLVPSPTTLLGLVSHAAAVERNWFQHYLGGTAREAITGNTRGDAPSSDVAADKTIGDVVAEFESACAASRRIAARFALDQTVPHDHLGQVSLRWIYVHIIREHARHIGHADIIREQIDGATGD